MTKISSPANVVGVVTECQVTVESGTKSNDLSALATKVPAMFTPGILRTKPL